MKFRVNSQVAFSVFVAAAVLAGCDDNASKNDQNAECTSNEQCADRQDGKTLCNVVNGVCVEPGQNPTFECTLDVQCVGRSDGKTQCDVLNHVCVVPGQNPTFECTSDTQCAGRSDGKTQCDLVNHVCVNPGETPTRECSSNEDCAGRQDGKVECDIQNGLCVLPGEKPAAVCGNGILEEGEICDKDDLGDKSCTNWPDFVDGTLVCDSTCHFNTSACVACTDTDMSRCKQDQVCSSGVCIDVIQEDICGDGVIGAYEDCENGIALTNTCADMMEFIDGELGCDATSCTFDTSACVVCTDTDTSLCQANEICQDGECVEIQTKCGNDVIEGDEKCDGSDLGGKECKDLSGFAGGKLACSKSCDFDTLGCVKCTDDDLSACGKGQICSDGNCVDLGHKVECGDGIVEDKEECEEGILNGQTCADRAEGKPAGDLKCTSCKFDTSECLECSTNAHCADRKDGKVICQDNVCIDPATIVIPKVVISQFYPAGGNSGAVFNTKFVELLNIDEDEVTLSNWSIQYAPPAKETITLCKLPETVKIPKGGYYLVALNKGTNGSDIPAADFTCKNSALSPATSDGKLFLVNGNEKIASTKPTYGYADAVGYGSANWGEGGEPMAKLSAKQAGIRKHKGCLDTDNNVNDFDKGTPAPRNSASPLNLCDGSEIQECNNSILEEGEDCDGNEFKGGKTACKDWNSSYKSGNVKCSDTCTIDYSDCSLTQPAVCKNGNLEEGEDCDGTLFKGNKTACKDWNSTYKSGDVKCSNTCTIDYSGCSTKEPAVCQNGNLEEDEDCDGTLFKGGKTACKDWNSTYKSGDVKCSSTCKIDYSGCSTKEPAVCQNGNLEEDENCDGTLFKGGKTACKDWDSSYKAGNVKCSDTCTIDYSDCKTTLCLNNKLDEGEDCDANLFSGNKTLCKDWKPGEYNKGEVSCSNECTIDYSECKFVDPTSCKTGQEWSEEYVSCVYPISSKQDLLDLSSKWNEQGKAAYPTNDGEDPVFLLKNDIDMEELTKTTWSPIGSLSNPFEAVFYGGNHTIKASLKNVSGLWEYTSYATIQDFTFQLEATGSAANFLASQVDHGTFKNINIKGTWNSTYYNTAGYGVFKNIENAALDNIRVDLDAVVERSGDTSTGYYVGIFMRSSKSSTLNRISLNGSFATHKDSRSIYLCLLAYESSNDRITNSEINMDVNVLTGNYIDDVNILMYKMDKNTVVDKMNIKKAAVTKHAQDEGHLIDTIGGDCSNCIISSLEDNTVYSTLGNTNLIDIPGNLTIVNSLFNGNVTTFMSIIGVIKYVKFVNDIFIKFTELSGTPALKQDVYFKADVDDKKVTAAKMNKNLADKKENIPSGTYLPWKQDSKDRFYLKFNASDSEIYVIP